MSIRTVGKWWATGECRHALRVQLGDAMGGIIWLATVSLDEKGGGWTAVVLEDGKTQFLAPALHANDAKVIAEHAINTLRMLAEGRGDVRLGIPTSPPLEVRPLTEEERLP